MEFGLNEQQEMLKKTARDFFQDKLPKTLVRNLMFEDQKGYSPELWKEMAELGWMGILIPEEYEGIGGDFIDLTVILEEMGRALLTGPFIATVVFATTAILKAGSEDQKQKLLPAIANGQAIFTYAVQDSADRFDAAGITTRASEAEDSYDMTDCAVVLDNAGDSPAGSNGEGYIIRGKKRLVPDAHVSDYIIAAARTSSSGKAEQGITLFVVPTKARGVKITVRTALDGKKLCDVSFNGVHVGKDAVLGEVGKGWPLVEKALQYLTVALCADSVGGTQKVMEMSANYAKERKQFDTIIGAFQAVKHKCANMLIDVEGSRPLTYWAAWAVDTEAAEAAKAVAMAKAWCSDAYRRVAADGIQVHGGIGFTWEHDMHLYYKRAKTIELSLGDADYHRSIVADFLEKESLKSSPKQES